MSGELETMKKISQVPGLEPEVEPVLTDSCEDDDIEPLTGKPFFPVTIGGSHIGNNHSYQLIPPLSVSRILPKNTVPVILTHGRKSWETTYLGKKEFGAKRFDTRWRAFAEDNKLKVGDVCVFELMECSDTLIKFKVQVLRGDIPSALLDKEKGTMKDPIVIE